MNKKRKPANGIIYRDERRKIEYDRPFQADEIRAEGNGETRILTGYAAVFDQETQIGDWYREVIRAGAFTKTLQEFDQVALWNHNDDYPLAKRSAGTLSLHEDERGLRFTIRLGDTTVANDLFDNVKRGVVNGMSFGFQVIRCTWHEDIDAEFDLRELLELKLYEVSPVTFPAYDGTSVEVNEDTARSILDDAIERGTTDEPEADHSGQGQADEPDRDNHSAAGSRLKRAQLLHRHRGERIEYKEAV